MGQCTKEAITICFPGALASATKNIMKNKAKMLDRIRISPIKVAKDLYFTKEEGGRLSGLEEAPKALSSTMSSGKN